MGGWATARLQQDALEQGMQPLQGRAHHAIECRQRVIPRTETSWVRTTTQLVRLPISPKQRLIPAPPPDASVHGRRAGTFDEIATRVASLVDVAP